MAFKSQHKVGLKVSNKRVYLKREFGRCRNTNWMLHPPAKIIFLGFLKETQRVCAVPASLAVSPQNVRCNIVGLLSPRLTRSKCYFMTNYYVFPPKYFVPRDLIHCSNGIDRNIQASFNALTHCNPICISRENVCKLDLHGERPVETAQLKWQSKWVLTLLNSGYCWFNVADRHRSCRHAFIILSSWSNGLAWMNYPSHWVNINTRHLAKIMQQFHYRSSVYN